MKSESELLLYFQTESGAMGLLKYCTNKSLRVSLFNVPFFFFLGDKITVRATQISPR